MSAEITFQHDERWVEKDHVMLFTAELRGRRVRCSLSEDVLNFHFAAERVGRFQAFRENRQQIEEVAAKKIEAGMSALVLGLDDFLEARDFIPWER